MKAKMLKCPKCGYVFKAPLMDRKKNPVYGWTLPGWGVIKCPKCGYLAAREVFAENYMREKEGEE